MFKKFVLLSIVSVAVIAILHLYRSKISSSLHLSQDIAASDVIATINDINIKARDLQFEVDLQLQDTEIRDMPSLQKEVLSELLERSILFEHLKNDHNFHFSDEECLRRAAALIMSDPVFYTSEYRQRGIRRKLCEQDAIYRYSQQRIFSNIIIDEEELAAFFAANKDRYLRPAAVSFRQIVLPNEKQAKRIRVLVNAQNFSDYAREHSIAPEADNGGLVGPLTKSELPQVFHVLFKMRANRITDVLKSTYGFHIILLLKKYASNSGGLENFRAAVEKDLLQQKQRAEYQKWLEVAMHKVSFSLPRW